MSKWIATLSAALILIIGLFIGLKTIADQSIQNGEQFLKLKEAGTILQSNIEKSNEYINQIVEFGVMNDFRKKHL